MDKNMLKHADLVPFEGNGEGLDTIDCYEVYRKGNLVLYEYENEKSPYDSAVSEDVVNELSEMSNISNFEDLCNEITEKRVRQEIKKGVQTIQYQINTLLTSNG